MSLQSNLAAASVEAGLLEAEAAALRATVVSQLAEIELLHGEVDDLEQALADCLGTEPPPPEPPPETWVPPMEAVQVPFDWGTPDIILGPGDNIRQAFTSGKRNILLREGSYGAQTLGAMPNTKVWCDVYRGARFANGTDAFVLPAAGMIVGGLQVENYGKHIDKAGGAMLATDGESGQWFINMAVGKSKGCGYSIKGDRGGIRGGELYDIAQLGWAGGGSDNIVEDLFYDTVGTLADGADPDSDTGLAKIVFSARFTVRRVCGFNCRWNVIWLDIQNRPGLIEDIFADGVARAVVFIEVSYGGEDQTGVWKTWRIRRIGGENPRNVRRGGEVNRNDPIPAVVQISATSDLDIEDVYGTGWNVGVALISPAGHKQITGETGDTDRSKLGLRNITITGQNTPGTKLFVASLTGSAHIKFPDMKQPGDTIKWVDLPPGGAYRDFSGTVTESAFRNRYT